jgi:hypothetical protein
MQTNQEDLYKVHSETLSNNVNVSASLCAPGAVIKGKIIDPEVTAVKVYVHPSNEPILRAACKKVVVDDETGDLHLYSIEIQKKK